MIERIAGALGVGPAELFSTEIPTSSIDEGAYSMVSLRLAGLSETDLLWVDRLLEEALKPRTASSKTNSPR